MYLKELKHENIFIDTNIFLYDNLNVQKYIESCKNFLSRIESGEVRGFTSVLVLNEIWYKLLVANVIEKYEVERKDVKGFIKKTPDVFKLKEPKRAVNEIEKFVKILPTPSKAIALAKEYSTEYLLLTSDAIILATMKLNNITNLASNDSDFERVDWINLYKLKKE